MDLYRDIILDHFHHPRNFGHLEHPDAVQEENNVSCGDRVSMEINTREENGERYLSQVRFSGEGCAINQASASMLTEKVIGMNVGDIEKLGVPDILEMIGTELTPSRMKCALLPLEVLQKALKKNKK